MSTQATTELFHTVASSVFLPSVAGGNDAFIASLSDLVVLKVEAHNGTKLFIMITERHSGRGCLLDAWEYPLRFGRRATSLVSWGYFAERLELLIIFPTVRAAEEFRRAVRGGIFQWMDELDEDGLDRLIDALESDDES